MFDGTSIWQDINKMMDIGERITWVSNLLSSFLGNEPAAGASPVAKGIYGLFGKKEERIIASILPKLDAEVKMKFNRLLQNLFKTDGSILQGIESILLQNDLLVFIAKKHDASKDDQDPALLFIVEVVKIIDHYHAGKAGEPKATTYRMVVQHFKAHGVPIAKVGTSSIAEMGTRAMFLWNLATQQVTAADAWLQTKATAAQDRKTPWWVKVMTIGLGK